MKRLGTLTLSLAVLAVAARAVAGQNEYPDWSPAKTPIFLMKTGREQGNLIWLLGEGGLWKTKKAETQETASNFANPVTGG